MPTTRARAMLQEMFGEILKRTAMAVPLRYPLPRALQGWQSRAEQPLLPLRLFDSRERARSCCAGAGARARVHRLRTFGGRRD